MNPSAVIFRGGGSLDDGEIRSVDYVTPFLEQPILRQESQYRHLVGGEDCGPAPEWERYRLAPVERQTHPAAYVYEFEEIRSPRVDICEVENCEVH